MDGGCVDVVMVSAPATCSDQCDIMASFTNVQCDPNGTPSDDSDDSFSFDVTVTGLNTGGSWTANDVNGTSGVYGSSVSFGPYPISGGDLCFTISDNVDGGWVDVVMVSAPATCSDQGDIMASFTNVQCDPNGTPSDESVDTFSFDVTVPGLNTGGGWSA